MHRPSRSRGPHTTACAAVALLLLTGCASASAPDSTTSAATDPAAASTSSGAGAARVVQTAFGPVDIPTRPQRAIALEGGVGPLLGAGITPLATADGDYEDAFLPDEFAQVADLPVVLGADGWDYEQIASLEPDLMIGFVRAGGEDGLSEEERSTWARLSAIAPTVLIASDGSASTKDATAEMSEALGDGADAEAARAVYLAKATQIRTDYADVLAGNVLAPVDFYDEITVYSPVSWPGDLVVDAGGALPAISAGITEDNAAFLSAEQLGTLTDVTAVLYEHTAAGQPGAGATELMALPTWQQLPAVRAGHAYGLRYFFADRYETGLVALQDLEAALADLRS